MLGAVLPVRYAPARSTSDINSPEGVFVGRRGLKRMAGRMAKRAGIQGEEGVAVCFGYRSMAAALCIGALESLAERIPFLPLIITLATWPMHRIALVTDQHAYIFKSRPFHRPGEKLGEYPIAPGTVSRGSGFLAGGKLTFSDGQVLWHSIAFRWRVRAVEEAANGAQ